MHLLSFFFFQLRKKGGEVWFFNERKVLNGKLFLAQMFGVGAHAGAVKHDFLLVESDGKFVVAKKEAVFHQDAAPPT